ncbi:MAG TPA: amino acid ABC transporter permease [Geminicoccaceae bacterium]
MFADFDFGVIVRALPFLLEGMQLSLLLTALAVAGGVVLGTLLALLRLAPVRPLAWLAAIYVNSFRSVPLILVIFWFYFLVPLALGRPVGGFASALIAFTLFEAAYYCEIIRAGIQSVPEGQTMAGRAIGLTPFQVYRYVTLPQAFRNMLPVLLTQGIILFQDTSLVYVVALRDFMTAASVVATRDGRLVEMYTFAAVVYFVICFAASRLVRRLQRTYAT